jgi:hypothetical protein
MPFRECRRRGRRIIRTDMPSAEIKLKSWDTGRNEPVLYLMVEEKAVRVVVPHHVWLKADIGMSLQVPEGDLEHPQVSAGIKWEF